MEGATISEEARQTRERRGLNGLSLARVGMFSDPCLGLEPFTQRLLEWLLVPVYDHERHALVYRAEPVGRYLILSLR